MYTPLVADGSHWLSQDVFSVDSNMTYYSPLSIEDAFFRSLNDKGEVRIDYIAALSNTSEKDVVKRLGSVIYQNPLKWEEKPYEGWETADEYLSGVLVDKLEEAQKAAKRYGERFQRNVDAIRSVLPKISEAIDMVILPGHPALRPDDVKAFLLEIACRQYDPHYLADDEIVRYDPISCTWKIKNRLFRGTRFYSTLHLSFSEIFEKLMNGAEIRVERYRNGKMVFDQAETLDANEKAGQLVRRFSEWIWKNPERKTYYSNWQYEHFGCVKKRQFNGEYLTFPGMNPEITLRAYQKNAVARILFSDNTLLAHDVGAGKTYVMIAAGMELRRLGKSKKNLYVVPNSLTSQWTSIFNKLYPQANVLTVEPKSFVPRVRQQVLHRIKDEDFDAIIMASSCFDQIELSFEYYKSLLHAELETIENARAYPRANKVSLDRKERSVKEKIRKAVLERTEKNSVYFDEMGVTTLFVDEAHLYKNVPVKSNANITGVNNLGSKKCASMLEKVHCVQRKTGGRGVVFATATPVTNSISDIYVMQQYLQNGTLKLLNLSAFDTWIAMFAKKTSSYEVDVTGKLKTVSRFTSIQNLHDLSMMLSDIVDYYSDKDVNVPDCEYHIINVRQSQMLRDVLESLSDRADVIHRGEISSAVDNFLKITIDAKKAALDVRLLIDSLGALDNCKVDCCAEEVARIYRKTMKQRGTQIIFCDSSIPKKDFNIYDELRRLLVKAGIPSEEIAYIHDADTDTRRSQLFDAMNKGDVRVLIGSTAKAGLGLNVQSRLKALHHLDIPWRPADMIQREGRICREGNQNEEVDVYRYITEGTFDAFSYQLLENKQKIISQLLSGIAAGECEEGIDDPVLSYAQIKALCVGDSTVRDLLEANNELRRYSILRQQSLRNVERLRYELDVTLPREKEQANERRRNCEEDAEFVTSLTHRGPSVSGKTTVKPNAYIPDKLERKRLRNQLIEAIRKNAFREEERVLTSYRGFELILPEKMDPHKPFIILSRKGRHYVDMNAESGLGSLARVDNAIDHLHVDVSKYYKQLREIDARRDQIREAIRKVPDYKEEIDFYTELIDEYHQILGGKE